MTTKNPYEIRTELLQLAQGYLQQQFDANKQFAEQAFHQMVDLGKVQPEDWAKHMPKFYDFKDILEKAKELYGFVNNESR
jgi:hypothetical protein